MLVVHTQNTVRVEDTHWMKIKMRHQLIFRVFYHYFQCRLYWSVHGLEEKGRDRSSVLFVVRARGKPLILFGLYHTLWDFRGFFSSLRGTPEDFPDFRDFFRDFSRLFLTFLSRKLRLRRRLWVWLRKSLKDSQKVSEVHGTGKSVEVSWIPKKESLKSDKVREISSLAVDPLVFCHLQ